jgi:hypothetical protein
MRFPLITVPCLLLIAAAPASAQWSDNPAENTAVITRSGEQVLPKSGTTSDGGQWVAWFDNSLGNYDVYAQRYDSKGRPMFSAGGLLVSNHPSSSWIMDWDMIVDDNDQAVMVFADIRTGGDFDIYAYCMDSNGIPVWGPNGVAISVNSDFDATPAVAQMTGGDYVVVWAIDAPTAAIRMQRLSPVGTPLLTPGGIDIASEAGASPSFARVIPGANDNAIVSWVRDLSFFSSIKHLRARAFSPTGAPAWPAVVEVFDDHNLPIAYSPELRSDGLGGAVLSWHSSNPARGGLYDASVQHLDASGNQLFAHNGVQLSSAAGMNHFNPSAVYNSVTGAIISFWTESDGGQSQDGWSAQQITAGGNLSWGPNGKAILPVDSTTKFLSSVHAVGDGAIAVIAWAPTVPYGADEIIATRVDSNGNNLWGGLRDISTLASSKSTVLSTSVNAADEVLVVWEDDRSGDKDIYAQNIRSDGYLGPNYLDVDVTTISLAAGGTAQLMLDAGSAFAGKAYVVLGSHTGTSPGIFGHGVHIDLNNGRYFQLTLNNPTFSLFTDFRGNLDASGRATASGGHYDCPRLCHCGSRRRDQLSQRVGDLYIVALNVPTKSPHLKILAPLSGLLFGAGAVALGLLSAPADGSASSTPLQPFLSELHLHGSLSEGTATMWHHSVEGAAAGYDVLWWTDHMERAMADLYVHEIDFNDGEFGWAITGLSNEFVEEGDVTSAIVGPPTNKYAAFGHSPVGNGSGWTEGGLAYESLHNFERTSLMAAPEIELDLKLPSSINPNHSSMVIRLTMSSRRNDVDQYGTPNVLEYVPANMPLPALPSSASHNVVQKRIAAVNTDDWTHVVLKPYQDVDDFYEGLDMSIRNVEIVTAGRNGAVMSVQLDNFRMTVRRNFSDLNLLRNAEDLVRSNLYPYRELTQHVGMEVSGPSKQEILTEGISTRDHLLALYPGQVPQLYDYVLPNAPKVSWPRAGVVDIQQDGGVAILAHMFGALPPSGETGDEEREILSRRVLRHRAWGADGMEIGYDHRGAPLSLFTKVWDQLAKQQTYITGVGVSDDHNVAAWSDRTNRMGTWIRAEDDTASSLAHAVKNGDAFFGDPFLFDPEGDLVFEGDNGAFTMGDVVVTAPGETHDFSVHIEGGTWRDYLVWFVNGEEKQRDLLWVLGGIDATFSYAMEPGDWVRVELQQNPSIASDLTYLFSNPIYFVASPAEVPPHRQP